MKKNKLMTILSIFATVGLSTSLVTTIASCSKNKFAGVDVLNEIFKPSYEAEPITPPNGEITPVPLIIGSEKAAKFYINNAKYCLEDYLWSSSVIANHVKNKIEGSTESAPSYGKVNKWTAGMSNLSITSQVANDGHTQMYASYTITQDIDINLDVAGDASNNDSFIEGHIRLAWSNNVNNMPMNCFDFDPASNDTAFNDNEQMWFMAPDMDVLPESNEEGWSIDYDILTDIDLNVYGDKLVKVNQEIQFPLNSDMVLTINAMAKLLAPEYMPLMCFGEKLFGSMSGWNSYYLSKTEQVKHVNWEESNWDRSTNVNKNDEELDNVTISLSQNALYNFQIEESYDFENEDIFVLPIGVDYDETLGISSVSFTPEIEAVIVPPEGQMDPVPGYNCYQGVYDWHAGQRPEQTTSLSTLQTEGLIKYNYICPIIVTRDWISMGRVPSELNDVNNSDMFTLTETDRDIITGPEIGKKFIAEPEEKDNGEPTTYIVKDIEFTVSDSFAQACGATTETEGELRNWEHGDVFAYRTGELIEDRTLIIDKDNSKIFYSNGKYTLNITMRYIPIEPIEPEFEPIPFSIRFAPIGIPAYQDFGEQTYTLNIEQ